MLGLSMTEVLIILALALLLLGPDQLPNLAKSLGKGLRELRKATDDIKGQFEQEMAKIDLDEQPQRMIAPVPPPALADKPAAPAALEAPAPLATPAPPAAEVAPEDPGAARAAARRAASVRLVPPEGTVPAAEKKT
jgi:sec-independent protein translocase protein TatB